MWSRMIPYCTFGVLALACSPSDKQLPDAGSGSQDHGSGGSGPGGDAAAADASSTLRDADSDADDLGDADTCADKAVGAHTTQVNLVFVYDKSASMGNDTNTEAEGYPRWENIDLRWNPAKAAMIAFFENPGAPELYASIKFFPHPGDYDATCTVANYEKPDVKLTPLTHPEGLIDALERTTPSGGTPTLPALQGAVSYAAQLMTDNPGSKSIIILVTDGEPVVVDSTGAARQDDCPPGSTNDIPSIAAVAEAAYNRPQDLSIPTYVVGIGEAPENAATIAAAGGTDLIYIAGDNGDDTKARLLEALEGIQQKSISCDVPIPDPEQGETIDYKKVNVDFVHSDGQTERLAQDTACGGAGWRYDNPSAPTKIMLCPTTCTTVQQDLDGQLQVAFGCDTIIK